MKKSAKSELTMIPDRWEQADTLARQLQAAESQSNSNLGSWSNDAPRLTDRHRLHSRSRQWTMLYAKEVADPG